MIRDLYRLHDQYLAVCYDDPRLGTAFREITRQKGSTAVTPVDAPYPLNLYAQYSAYLPQPPESFECVDRPAEDVEVWMDDGRFLVRNEHAAAAVQPAIGQAAIHLKADCPDSALFLAGSVTLIILLAYRERYAIHAGAACKGTTGCVFVGASGSGKSTLVMGLIEDGWNYLSDDTLLLQEEENHISVLSYRSDFALDPTTLRHFPGFHPDDSAQTDGTRKRWIDIRALVPDQFTASCRPTLLIFPEIVDAAESRLQPIDKNTALQRLLPQSGMFMIPDRTVAQRRMNVLRQFIDQTSTHRLLAGRDLKENPGHITNLLPLETTSSLPNQQP